MAYIDLPVDIRKGKGGRVKNTIKKYIRPVLSVFLSLLFLQLLTRYFIFYPLTVQDESMSPALPLGSRIFILHPHLANIQKGDVVLINAEEGKYKILCRVTANEGERVEILQREVFVSGKPMRKSAGSGDFLPPQIDERDNMPISDIRAGSFFCLNDNWQMTSDSRRFGPFSLKQIQGKVIYKGFLGFSVPPLHETQRK